MMRWKNISLNIITILLTILTPIHFFIIVLHAGPINPISAKFQPQINAYVTPFFFQNWHLFAPDPVTTNFNLYLKVKYKEAEHTEIIQSDWLDVVGPILKKNDETLLSPYNRMVRLGLGYVHALELGGHDELTYKLLKKISDEDKHSTRVEEKIAEQIELQKDLIYRYVSAYAKAAYPNKEIIAVQFMTGRKDTVSYSKRNDEGYEVQEKFDIYEWREVVSDVLSFP